jgi:predicted DNA-binding protein (UPF0251 family)
MEECAHRFWTKVKFGPDCWIWQGAILKGHMKYSLFKVKGRMWHAHRVSYWLAWGPIPKGAMIRHTCDNASCVRPDHLIPGTHQQNMDDRSARGRHAHGARQGLAKLTDEIVLEARRLYATGKYRQKDLAVKYGVSQTTIGKALTGEQWSHVKLTAQLVVGRKRSTRMGRFKVPDVKPAGAPDG